MTGLDAAARIAAELERPTDAQWSHAPGRVNLIGEHTDYNDGFVLPFAVDRSCVVAARGADTVRVRSLDAAGVVEVAADGRFDPSAVQPPWGRYVAGVVHELAALGRPPVGIDAVLASDVPLGSGLSSSAALEVACAVALCEAADWRPARAALAEACRRAEELATGVPCGIMDQLVAVVGRAGHAQLVDCRSLELSAVPLPPGLGVVAVYSGKARTLASSAYAERRRACEALARKLGVPALRDATASQVRDDAIGRHVVSENARVLESVSALEDGDLARLGALLDESHASLRDDFGISTPELDALVEVLRDAGALGARLMGGGFGGSVVAVCDVGDEPLLVEAVEARCRARTGLEPQAFVCRAGAGAGPLEPGAE